MAGRKTMLVAGATGVVGEAAVAHFAALDDWDVIAVSRREPEPVPKGSFRHLAVDLTSPEACRVFAELSDVTHVIYAALYEKPGLVAGWREQDQMETNLSMLANLMEPLAGAAKGLRHVTLLQGTKAYGAHVHPRIRIPAREKAPRDAHENFYWLQEDYLRAKAAERGWNWTIFRPQIIVGAVWGAAMNPLIPIGVYAGLLREQGRPLAYPGGVTQVSEMVDPRLLAQAFAWAADNPAAAGQHFNITNGDVYTWRDLWPAIADELGMEAGLEEPCALAEYLPAQAPLWDRIVQREGLRPIPLERLLGESHHYADLLMSYAQTQVRLPILVSTIKLRQAGFGACYDSEDTVRYWLDVMVRRKLIPGARRA